MFDQFRLHRLPNNEALLYHESQVFPPGYGTIEIAKEASSKVNQIRKNLIRILRTWNRLQCHLC